MNDPETMIRLYVDELRTLIRYQEYKYRYQGLRLVHDRLDGMRSFLGLTNDEQQELWEEAKVVR